MGPKGRLRIAQLHRSSHPGRVEEDGDVAADGQAGSPRRRRGPSPWLNLVIAVFWSGLGISSWITEGPRFSSIVWTVGGVAFFLLSWYQWRHPKDPSRPVRGGTSRWAGGRPEERWH
jgi:hypothetical protein